MYAPLLVLVFLGSCRLLFGKGRICGCPAQSKHQADNLAKLRQEFLPVTELIAKIFGAVSRTTSLMRLSALLVNKRCRCRDDGFCSGCACVAHVLRVRSEWAECVYKCAPNEFSLRAHKISIFLVILSEVEGSSVAKKRIFMRPIRFYKFTFL